MAKHVDANNSLQDLKHFSGKASNSPTHQALSRTSPQIRLLQIPYERLNFVCRGSQEEFVQLMKKSLMAEQLYAEGVGPSQKIEDIWIHLGWWLGLIWSHESNEIFNFTWSQNIYRAVSDVWGFSLGLPSCVFLNADSRRRGYPHCGHARCRRFVWSPSDSPTGLSPDFGRLGFKMFGKFWTPTLVDLNRSM